MAPKKKLRPETVFEPVWQYHSPTTTLWTRFTPTTCATLETSTVPLPTTEIIHGGTSWTVDCAKKQATDSNGSASILIRRIGKGVWEYPDDQGIHVAFYDEDNDVIESAYRSCAMECVTKGSFQTTALTWNKGYDSKYSFEFDNDAVGGITAVQKNEDSGTLRSLRRSEAAAVQPWTLPTYGIASMALPTLTDAAKSSGVAVVDKSVMDPPATWQPQTSPLQFFTVPSGTAEYNSIIKPFMKTLQQKDATVHSLERIQNDMLWKFYALTRHRVATCNGGDPNERLLYHGARARENMDAIINFGFDMRVANSGSAGVGIYFAVHASYSNSGYVLRNASSGVKEIFVCRVSIGSCTQGKHGLLRPPAKSGKKTEKDQLHDSVHNNMNVMFIVFDNCQAYPEYLIKYKTKSGW